MAFAALAKRAKSKKDWQKAERIGDKDSQGSIDDFLTQWAEIQREACEAQATLLKDYLEYQEAKFHEVMEKHALQDGRNTKTQVRKPASHSPRTGVASGDADAGGDIIPAASKGPAATREEQAPMKVLRLEDVRGWLDKGAEQAEQAQAPAQAEQAQVPAQATTSYEGPAFEEADDDDLENLEEQVESLTKQEEVLDAWRRSDGMHTVEKWCSNYLKHPAGWGALLMIHGIPEVTGRLRSKVENYAIYSALFLSVSMTWLADPPGHIAESCEALSDYYFWECEVQKRLFAYLLGIGTGTHMLSILLAMTFINVLNEAARDSDVIRMFARGKGFVATVKVQYLFRIGCVADFASMVIAAKVWLGWDVMALAVLMIISSLCFFKKTAGLLWRSASIVSYWRSDLGGKPDADDPYSIDFPLSCLKSRATFARNFQEIARRLESKSQPAS